MAYYFMLDTFPLPIPPSALTIKTPSMNKTVTLINDGEINIPKNQGLREISFEFLIPAVQKYPFATYHLGMLNASAWILLLKYAKSEGIPFPFTVARMTPGGQFNYFTSIVVLIEDVEFKEDASEYGLDTMCSITLKEYKPYGTKRIKLEKSVEGKPGQAKVTNNRSTVGKSQPKKITTQKNETVVTGAHKTGDKVSGVFDTNDIKIPESITTPEIDTSSWMQEILPDVDLETYATSQTTSSSKSLADELMLNQGSKIYSRPTVPKPEYKFDWEGLGRFFKDPTTIMERF